MALKEDVHLCIEMSVRSMEVVKVLSHYTKEPILNFQPLLLCFDTEDIKSIKIKSYLKFTMTCFIFGSINYVVTKCTYTSK